ncbi:MAG: helix-turn-helix domain-containing protein [Lachnospiraceae bacterium]
MNTANRELIEEATKFIEMNLKNELSLGELSSQLCISKYHLHRIFKAITGMPLMAYVRKRRLSESLTELRDEKLKIIDIACEYHFEYMQSYERAFKQLFGITPSAFRRHRCELPIIPRLDTKLLQDVSGGILTSPFYIKKPEFHLAGIRTLIWHQENYALGTANLSAVDFYYNRRLELETVMNESVYYGLVTSYHLNEADYYMPSVEVPHPVKKDSRFCYHTIKASDYAVFRYIGLHSPENLNMHLLSEIYQLIENVWIPSTSFSVDRAYHFERIDTKRCGSSYCEADIYYPILPLQ